MRVGAVHFPPPVPLSIGIGTLMAAAVVVSGCADARSPAKQRAVDYLREHVDGTVGTNVRHDYAGMLERLTGSEDRCIYLGRKTLGRYLQVYWFGEDARPLGVRLNFADGTTEEHFQRDSDRSISEEALRHGTPQQLSVLFDGDRRPADVITVELLD